MNLFKSLLCVSLFFILSACGDEKVNSTNFYIANDDARLEKLKWCKQNAERKIQNGNCTNAADANAQIKSAKMLGLPKPVTAK